MTSYTDFKASVLGKKLGDGECVALIDDSDQAYVEQLFPGVPWTNVLHSVNGAKDLAGISNQYVDWIPNDHNDPNQVPNQGDIMVFGATPAAGYTNTYNNPYGHTGVCESADSNGYNLLQQNAPSNGAAVNVTHYAWKFRPCLGWLRPKLGGAPTPAPQPAPVVAAAHTIHLYPTTGPWHLYPVGGPYVYSAAKGLLWPSRFPGGLTYNIDQDLGNGIYVITSQDYGQGCLNTKGSDVEIQ